MFDSSELRLQKKQKYAVRDLIRIALDCGGGSVTNDTRSFLNRLFRSPIFRHATIPLVALAWSNLAFCGEVTAPALTVVVEGSFQYEQFMQMVSRVPTAPNSWHIESKITSNDHSQIEVLPIYLYSEIQPGKTNAFENSSTICPKSFSHAFTAAAQHGLTIAPTDLSGTIQTTVGLPMRQMDEPPDLSRGNSIAAMVGSHTFAAALTVDAKPVGWGKLSISPHSTINAIWEFGSIWAAPEKVRPDESFQIVQLGPVIRSVSAAPRREYLVVVRLNYVPTGNGGNMKQSSVQFIKVTPSLPKDIAKAFPGFPSVEEFGNATTRLVTVQGFGVVQESPSDPRLQIIEAMDKGDGETACKLAKAHPDLFDAKASDGTMPLHFAVAFGHKDVAELLLAKGADVNAKANNGFAPLHVAAGKGQKDLAELLLVKGADINAKDSGGMTPLLWAARYGYKDFVELLLAKGADVNAKEKIGTTALDFASRDGHKDVAELLLAKGADVNAKDSVGGTALHTAAWKGQKDVAELLLAKGADVNARTDQGLTPLGIAIRFHQDDFANWLRARGAKE